MHSDPIADLLTRIRNAYRKGHPTIQVSMSQPKERILQVLKNEGYVDRIDKMKDARGKEFLKVFLRYVHDNRPVVKDIKRLSRPGRRMYVGAEGIPNHRGGLGLVVVSTSRGMLSGKEAKEQGVGGELICSVF